MEDDFYASMLQSSSSSLSDEEGDDNQSGKKTNGCEMVVLVSPPDNASSSCCRVSVACRRSRNRRSVDDVVQFIIYYYSFLEEENGGYHLDSLLTRLAPISHISISTTLNPNTTEHKNVSGHQAHRMKQVVNRLQQLTELISSRKEVFVGKEAQVDQIPTFSKNKIKDDSVMAQLLGGEGSDRFVSYQHQQLHPYDLSSIYFLLQQLNITSSGEDQQQYEILKGHLNSHLALDRTASECIHLLPRKGVNTQVLVGGNDSNNSLFGIFASETKTRMGKRLLELWLRQPLTSLDEINNRQTAVTTLVQQSISRDALREEGFAAISGMDLQSLAVKIEHTTNSKSTRKALECLYKLHLFATRGLPAIQTSLSNLDLEEQSLLSEITHGLNQVQQDLSRSVQLVEAVLDMEAAPREFLVQASHHESLGDVRTELNVIQDELQQHHSQMNHTWNQTSGSSSGSDQVRLETMSEGGWQFRLPDTNSSKQLQDLPNITIHRLLKNGVYFSTKELRQLGTKQQDLLREYESVQKDIVQNAMAVGVTYVPVLERAHELISKLDVLQSMAHVAAMNHYCCPTMTDSEEEGQGIELKDARHPCVELQDSSATYIPNDFHLIFGESSFLLVTGPNMGGKSTYLRSLGAIVAMAQIGSYVPCTSATINIVHHILARVGAGDFQDRGISTFMAEMLEASAILKTATKRSLILMDELGRGTSTHDGYGLASAISQYMVKHISCMTVFATHFHELTSLSNQYKDVQNCHVTAACGNDGNLTFLYQVQPGPCLESFGIQVAEMANVPSEVIQSAKRKAQQLSNKNNDEYSSKDHEDATIFMKKFTQLPLTTLTHVQKKQAIQKLLQ